MILRQINHKPYLKLKVIATLIDYGIFGIFYFTFMYVFDDDPTPYQMSVNGVLALVVPFVWFIYFVVTESTNQATLGHQLCKLKVVKLNGDKLSLGSAFKRRMLDIIDLFIYGIPAFICVLKTSKHQRLGDLWAETVVIKESDIVETIVTF